jgi:putative solute:sodium symporter small subunit
MSRNQAARKYAGSNSLASPQKATNWPALAATETGMINQLLQGELPRALAQAQNSPQVVRTKRMLLTLLGFWMAYFLLVNWFVHSLNKISVPFVGIPLGFYLAAQGAVIVFGIVLFRFARSAE